MLIPSENLNFDKDYDAILAIGCSFTEYWWPTWANVIEDEFQLRRNVTFCNIGSSGAGNLYIHNKLSEALQPHTDEYKLLILVMWSTHCREDRWLSSRCGWLTAGNIYTQNMYNTSFVKEFADPMGYLIRDLGLISSAKTIAKTSKHDVIFFHSVPLTFQQESSDQDILYRVLNTYKSVEIDDRKTLISSVGNGNISWGDCRASYYHESLNSKHSDYHPLPDSYSKFLIDNGILLSKETLEKARLNSEKVLSCPTRNTFATIFPRNHNQSKDSFYTNGFSIPELIQSK